MPAVENYFQELFGRDGLHCGRQSFLKLRCILETVFLKNKYTEHVSIPPFICYNMWNISISDFSKHWLHLISARCSSNAISTFQESDYISLTYIVWINCTRWKKLFLPQDISLHTCLYITVKYLIFPPVRVGDISTVFELIDSNSINKRKSLFVCKCVNSLTTF